MKVIFNDKEYKKNGRNGTALRELCFDIFAEYLSQNKHLRYNEVQQVFNKWHCNNNFVVLNKPDWEQKTDNLKGRYFAPVNYNGMELYFTTQWGNNGGACDNIDKIINFAKDENYNIDIIDRVEIQENNIEFLQVKNIILYGSPGVGKTYSHKKLIALIEGSDFKENEIFDFIINNKDDEIEEGSIEELFEKVKQEQRMKFITFHQSFGYEDFIEGFRPNKDGKINLEKGVFRNICEDAQANLDDSLKNIQELEKESNLLSKFKDYINYKLENNKSVQLQRGGEFKLVQFENNKLLFGTSSESVYNEKFIISFDDFQKIYASVGDKYTLQDISNILGTNSIQQKYAYFLSIYNDFKEYEKHNIHNVKIESKIVDRKNYYLIIDEINRGNISKIFGELITLIEEDKRDTLEVTLPYSKKPFKIPSNLYIIGTMNSTDKSIALIDIALRRRFTFLKMKPKADLINYPKARQIFEAINKKITETLGEDYQIGHSYFMKIQNTEDLEFVLEYKIIPLLEEYYYGDDRLTDVIALCKQDTTLDNDEQ